MLYRLFLFFSIMMACSLGIFGAGFIWLPPEFINVPMLGKYMIAWAIMWAALASVALEREHNRYWADKDRELAERKQARLDYVDKGRLKGLWP